MKDIDRKTATRMSLMAGTIAATYALENHILMSKIIEMTNIIKIKSGKTASWIAAGSKAFETIKNHPNYADGKLIAGGFSWDICRADLERPEKIIISADDPESEEKNIDSKLYGTVMFWESEQHYNDR